MMGDGEADSARAMVSRIELMSYTDFSHITTQEVQRDEGVLPESFASSESPWSKEPPFQLKLHKILSDPECRDAIRWLPHGRAWKIIDQKKFEGSILEKHFRHSRFLSFMRQVTGWDFKRITSGDDEGAYYHEYFLRGLPHICLKMRRKAGKGSKSSFSRLTIAPDFGRISELHPLPDENGQSSSTSSSSGQSSSAAPKAQEPVPTPAPTPAENASSSAASAVSVSSAQLGGANGNSHQSLPQHCIPTSQEPFGVRLPNAHGTPAPALSDLVSSLYNGRGAASGAGVLPSNGTNLHTPLTAMNLQSLQLQMLAALVNAPQPQPQPQFPLRINSLDLLSAASRLAAPANVSNNSSGSARTVSDTFTNTPSLNTSSSSAATSSHPSDTSSAVSTSERRASRHRKDRSNERDGREPSITSSESAESKSMEPPTTSSSTSASASASARRHPFTSRRKFGETSSGSGSSSSAIMNESGSDSSTEHASRKKKAQGPQEENLGDEEMASSTGEGKVANDANEPSLRQVFESSTKLSESSSRSSSSVSMSETGSDPDAPQTSEKPTEREEEDQEEDPPRIYNEESGQQNINPAMAEAGATVTLRRHFTSRRKVGDTSSRSSSSVSMSESGSDSSTQPTLKIRNLDDLTGMYNEPGSKLSDRKVETASTALQQAFSARPKVGGPGSDQSSSSGGISRTDSTNPALKKLWDLVSSADEGSNSSAIPLIKASRGLVGALIDGDTPSDSLEDSGADSDAVSMQPTARASRQQRSESSEDSSNDALNENSSSRGSRSPRTLDVAAKAMTLGILWGMANAEKGGGSVGPPLSEVTGSQSDGPRDMASNAEGAFDFKSVAAFDFKSVAENRTLHTSTAEALQRERQKMQEPAIGSDDASDDALRASSVSESSDGDSQRVCVEDKVLHRAKGADGRRKRSATAAFEPPAEVTWAHKRKEPSASNAKSAADAPNAKRRARRQEPSPPSSSSSQHSSEVDGAKAGSSASGRREPRIMRSLSSLTTHLSDCSTVSSKKLGKRRLPTPPTKENTRVGESVPANSTWNQTSDISGEDFETGSSQSGSLSSNNDEPVVTGSGVSSGISSGSTSRPPAMSSSGGDLSSELSSSGDDRVCARGDSNKAPLTTGDSMSGEASSALNNKVDTVQEPAKKRLKATTSNGSEKVQQ